MAGLPVVSMASHVASLPVVAPSRPVPAPRQRSPEPAPRQRPPEPAPRQCPPVPAPRMRLAVPAPPEHPPVPAPRMRLAVPAPPERLPVAAPRKRYAVSAFPERPQMSALPEHPQVPDRAPTFPKDFFLGGVVGVGAGAAASEAVSEYLHSVALLLISSGTSIHYLPPILSAPGVFIDHCHCCLHSTTGRHRLGFV